jgi:hypothetical protein
MYRQRPTTEASQKYPKCEPGQPTIQRRHRDSSYYKLFDVVYSRPSRRLVDELYDLEKAAGGQDAGPHSIRISNIT